jgi:hypothetical protein
MNINLLQNIIIDKDKVRELVKDRPVEEIERLFGYNKSQAYNVKNGLRLPSRDGILRLMMLHGLSAEDLATVGRK